MNMGKRGLNVGSGQRKFSTCPEVTWTNIDAVSRPGHEPDLVADGAHLPEEWAGTVDYFVLSHVLEHFGCGEAAGLIKEAYRVLKPGGSLLVFVPDMKALARRWLTNDINDYIFFVNTYGAFMSHEEDRHKWGYTDASLRTFLQDQAQWVLTRFNWRTVPGMDAARDWWVLDMEARKVSADSLHL